MTKKCNFHDLLRVNMTFLQERGDLFCYQILLDITYVGLYLWGKNNIQQF